MASVGPAPSIPRHNNGAQTENNYSDAEQDCKISSSNHLTTSNPLQNLNNYSGTPAPGSSTSSGGISGSVAAGSTEQQSAISSDRQFFCDASTVPTVVVTQDSSVSVTSRGVDSGGSASAQSDSVMFNPADPSRNSNNCYNTSDSSISSSTNNYIGGGIIGESDLDASGESSSNYRAPLVAEDDAGSSSHSEVRSSSPGLADADADVEDSPSGSEETGSESERGGNSAPNMYAPNTVGFPPSRSSLTHCIPSSGSFGSTVKFAPGSNPFAVKGLPAGSISSSSSSGPITSSDRSSGSQNSNSSFSPNSRINAGRWGSSQPQPLKPASLNTRPIIRPSALGSSLGGSGVTSSTPTGTSLGASSVFGGSSSGLPNFFDMAGADSSDQTGENTATTSSFVLRPPKLSNPFGLGATAARAETGFLATSSSVFGSAPETSTTLEHSNVETAAAEAGNEVFAGRAEKSEADIDSECSSKPVVVEPSMVFVPLAMPEAHSDSVSTTGQSTSGLFSVSCASTSGTSSFSGISTPGAVASSSSSSFSAVTQSDSDKASAFVFGSNLAARVSHVAKEQEDTPSANGISSSSASDGLFSAALRNVQPSSSSSQEPVSGSKGMDAQPGTSAFGDAESHADRKRRFEDLPVITGEEDEFNVLQITCRLFGFDGHTSSWTERGRGQLRLNDRTESNNDLQSRIIVRTKGSLRLMLNTNVWAGMKVDRTSNKSVRFSANDNGHLKLFLVMATVGEADQFYQALDWRIKTLKAYEDQQLSQISEATSSSVAASNNSNNDDTLSASETSNKARLVDVRRSSLVLPDDGAPGFVDKPSSDCDSPESSDAEDDNDLHDSPTKKKRFIDHPPQASSTGGGGGHEASKEGYCGFRPTPTILINNHDMNDLDDDEGCLD